MEDWKCGRTTGLRRQNRRPITFGVRFVFSFLRIFSRPETTLEIYYGTGTF